MIIRHPARRRGGATTVEFVFVAIMLFMMLFGIFEYGRFLFMYHLTTNACRDGARFACVHTSGGTMPGEPASITTADVQEVVRTGMFSGKSYGTGMCGMERQITSNWTSDCQVYSISQADLAATPPSLDPAGKPAWNAAPFNDKIAVRVTGTYKPVVPNLIGLPTSIDFKVLVLMSSEAN
ncbi:MAG TPA: TadE family protein [Gemmataceae bacterium]|nr:TadE family protein [Gemmataceae bacterium]